MLDKIELYHEAQSWFAKNTEVYLSTRERALEIISKKVCDTMQIQRAGIWMLSPDNSSLKEELTYQLNGTSSKGDVLPRKVYPIYFGFIEQDRVVTSTNTRTDYPLSEFVDSYMIPHNVHALMDAPIYSDGKMIGILCCEDQKGPREWDILDKNFAATCADFIARLLEAEKRHAYENELKHRIDYLENDLRKKLDDLKEAKFSLDLALEGAQAGKWDWQIDTNIMSYNKTYMTKLGYEYHELPQDISAFRKVVHPDDFERVMRDLEDHLQGKTPFYESRFRMLTKSGEIQFCIDRGSVTKRSHDGQPLRMTGVNVNITPIVQLEQSLILSQEQLQAMIRSLPTPVAMFDKDFKFLAYSTRWEQEWGQIQKVDIGNSLIEAMNFKDEWTKHMKMGLEGQTINRDEDFVELSPDVSMWLRWVIQPWKLATGEIGGVIVMAENITHRKEAEMRITQSSKLSALGEMAGGIAHEINNPLSIIKGYIDLLKRHSSRNTLNQDTMLQYIDKMDQTVGRISRIVNGMRRFFPGIIHG